MKTSLLEVTLAQKPPLDTNYCPSILGNRNYRQAVAGSTNSCPMHIALERTDGCVARIDMRIFRPGSEHDADTIRFVERQVKSLLWVHGGSTLYLGGPREICETIRRIYSASGARAYDANRMHIVYDKPFEVCIVEENTVPAAKEQRIPIGGFLDGCRIGFDLGASDYKLAAVIGGEAVFTTEIPWNPSVQTDPEYYYKHISDGLKLAAKHLPCVDAIGGSAAGAHLPNDGCD